MTTVDSLIALYSVWNAEQCLNLGSADEHLLDQSVSAAQREWLTAFVALWDASIATDAARDEVQS